MKARVVGVSVAMLVPAGVLYLFFGGGSERSADPIATGTTAEAAEPEVTPTALEPVHEPASAAEAPAEPPAAAPKGRTPAVAELAELLVLDGAGAPLAGARWVVFRAPADVLDAGETGGDGRARTRLAPEVGEAEIAIHRDDCLTQRLPVNLASRPSTVQLSADGEIAGRVTVDGKAPVEAIELDLSFNGPPLRDPSFLPEPVWEALGPARGVHRLPGTVAADGAFRFLGLEPGQQLRLRWPEELGPPPGKKPITDDDLILGGDHAVVPPERDLLLDLWTRPSVVGRAVDAAGAPVPSAGLNWDWSEGAFNIGRSDHAREDGTFRLLLGSTMPTSIVLRVSDPDFFAGRTHELRPPSGAHVYDAGDVAILPTRRLVLELSSRGGAPVTEADVELLAASGETLGSVECTQAGRCELRITSETSGLRIAAPGYRVIELAPPPGERATVELEGDTLLEVRLIGEQDLVLEIECFEPAFSIAGRVSWLPAIPLQSGWWAFGGGPRTTLGGAGDGTYLLSGLRPGLPLVLRAIDAAGSGLAEQAVSPLAEGEQRRIELRIDPAALRSVSGIVLDARGAPLPGAAVRIMRPGWKGTEGARTGDDGAFRLRTASDRATLVVQHGQHAPLVASDLAAGEEPHLLRLASGATLTVEVVDSIGRPFQPRFVGAEVAGGALVIHGEATGQGTYVLRHLPEEELTLAAHVGAHRIERRLDPAALPVARIEVPATVDLVVLVAGAPEPGLAERITLRLESLGTGPATQLFEDLHGQGEVEVRFSTLLPGAYELQVLRFAQQDSSWTPCGEAQTLDVTAPPDGGPARVVLRVEGR